MAEITKTGVPSVSSLLVPPHSRLSGRIAGEAIGYLDACYIAANGKVMLSDGTAADELAKVRGYAMTAADIGEAVTLVWDVNAAYGSGLTPGADLFLSDTVPGGLADTATTGGSAPIGYVVDLTRVHLWRSSY